jgi:hypothetical protein
MENGSGNAVSEPPKDMPEDLVAIRATLTDPRAIAEFDRMFGRLGPEKARAVFTKMSVDGKLEERLVRRVESNTVKFVRTVAVGPDVAQEIDELKGYADSLIQNIQSFGISNHDVAGIDEMVQKIEGSKDVLDRVKFGELNKLDDVAEYIRGERANVDAVAAELRVAQHSEGVTHIGRQVYVRKDGKRRPVEIDVTAKSGLEWIEVKNKDPFGIKSSEWSSENRSGKTGRGLKEQAELMLMASAEHKVNGKAPKVIVELTKSTSYEVAEELRNLRYTDPVTHEVYAVEVRGAIEPPKGMDH